MSGRSIHIGLNYVDSSHYTDENGDPWDGALSGCVNDANDMYDIANERGFDSQVKLINDEATVAAVSGAIEEAAGVLGYGDLLLVSYSGHGGQRPDSDTDELDYKDETWVLYDRELLDDEISALLTHFSPGVRILVVSDSCHSGTVARMMALRRFYGATLQIPGAKALSVPAPRGDAPPRFRFLPPGVATATARRHKKTYDAAKAAAAYATKGGMSASVILLSGCQDNQFSYDGEANGAFTERLLTVWQSGGFVGSHKAFLVSIGQEMRPDQTPNYSTYGEPYQEFEAQTPFTVAAPDGVTPSVPGDTGAYPVGAAPSVRGPDSWSPDDEPPSFSVNAGVGRWFVFEITSDGSQFDPDNEWLRGPESWYASWEEGERFTGGSYTLPYAVWERLKANPSLSYRIGTTTSETEWDDYEVSTGAESWWEAPTMEITTAAGDWDGGTKEAVQGARPTASAVQDERTPVMA